MGITSFARRVGRHRHALGRNPLVRISDRLEALTILAVLALAVFALPLAARAGDAVFDAGVRTATEQAHSRHAVVATAVDGSTGLQADFEGPSFVRAQWHEGTRLRSEQVVTLIAVTAGDSMKVWLDETGKVVAAPLQPDDAKLSAAGAAGTTWVALVACGAFVAFVIRRWLDSARDRAWERELNLMAHNDDGWANRSI